jgi:hypothetical protein
VAQSQVDEFRPTCLEVKRSQPDVRPSVAYRLCRLYLPTYRRHAFGYKLAGEGQDTRAIHQYLRHKNITHAVRSTELSPIAGLSMCGSRSSRTAAGSAAGPLALVSRKPWPITARYTDLSPERFKGL